jgi:hypothetical protein
LPSVSAPDEVGTLVAERPIENVPGGAPETEQAGGKRPRQRRSSGPGHVLGRRRWTTVDTLVVLGLVAIGVAVPAAAALWSHAFGVPRYDDWAYRRVLSDFVQTGHISLVGWGAMSLIGQILWAAPFAIVLGGHPWVASFSVAVASAIGISCAYWLARAVVGRVCGVACTLLVLAAPGFLVNTSTFMTDLPAFSAEIACLALGVAALDRQGRDRWALLAASMVLGCVGFSVREFDLAAPIAVLVTLALQDRIFAREGGGKSPGGAWSGRGRHLRPYVVAGAGLVIACAAIYVWTWQLPGAQHEGLRAPSVAALRSIAGGYFALALFVAPFLPAAAWRSWTRPSIRGTVVAGAILAVGALLMATGSSIFSGNYLTPQGMSTTATLTGFRPVLFPGPIWTVLELVGIGAGTVLGFLAVNSSGTGRTSLPSWRAGLVTERTVISIFTWLSGAGLLLYGLFVQGPIFDRYVWPLVFATAMLLAAKALAAEASRPASVATPGTPALATMSRWAAGGATVLLALLAAALATTVTLNADSYDGARWSAGQMAVKAGARANAVDAGFDWVGSHAAAPAVRARQVTGVPSYEMWYDQLFPGFRDCAFVSGSLPAPHGTSLIGIVRYKELGFAVPEHLFIYAVKSCAAKG